MRRLALAVVGFFAMAGCNHSYIVDRASLQSLRDAQAEGAVRCVIPATRGDGLSVVVRADSVLRNRDTPVDGARSRITARRGRAWFIAGIVLDLVGAPPLALGAATFTGDHRGEGNPPAAYVIGLPLLVVGGGHLITGVVLTAVGASERPDGLQSKYPRCATATEVGTNGTDESTSQSMR